MPRYPAYISNLLCWLAIGAFVLLYTGQAQTRVAPDQYVVRTVQILGNKVTKDYIIEREVSFKEGSILSQTAIDSLLEAETYKLINTDLFQRQGTFITYTELGAQEIAITIVVSEKWYTWPLPVFEIADRSINEWIRNRGASLDRVNLGIDFLRRNFRGRNETLELSVKRGFRNQYRVVYRIPFIDKAKTIGLHFLADISEFSNPDFAIRNNRGVALEREIGEDVGNNLRVTQRVVLGLSKRNKYYFSHGVQVAFLGEQIDSLLFNENRDYLATGTLRQRAIALSYQATYNKTDFVTYPTKGHIITGALTQEGIGVFNDVFVTSLSAAGAYYVPLTKRFFHAIGFRGVASLQRDQSYNQLRRFGFNGNIVRGYDESTGLALSGFIFQNTFRFKMLDDKLTLPRFVPRQFRTVPISIYPKVYVDRGYFYLPDPDPTNTLVNEQLLGYGFGFDLVSFYNSVARFEWSANIQDRKLSPFPFFYFTLSI